MKTHPHFFFLSNREALSPASLPIVGEEKGRGGFIIRGQEVRGNNLRERVIGMVLPLARGGAVGSAVLRDA